MRWLVVGLLLISQVSLAGLPPTVSRISGEVADSTTFKFRFPNFAGTRTGTLISLGVNSVAGGGTGLGTLTLNSVVLGNGTSTPLFVAPSTSGNILTSNGTTWQSTAPASGSSLSVTTITANTTLVNTDNAIICNAVAGGFTVTLETAVGNSGVVHHLKKSDTTTNIVTVDANGSQTIDGDLTLDITDPLVSITIVSDGSNWHVL